MKKTLTLLSFIFLLIKGYGQDWELFPLNQRSYYKCTAYSTANEIVQIINQDSIKHNNGYSTLYFNSKQLANPCLSIREIQSRTHDRFTTFLGFDSGSVHNDTSYFPCVQSSVKKYFTFYAHAGIHESWTIPGTTLTFSCDSIYTAMIFNEPDSFKYFRINKSKHDSFLYNFPFTLSKHHGLVEFVDFGKLLFNNPSEVTRVKLTGYEQGPVKRGMFIPGFDGFFHLSAGDVLYWHYTYENDAVPSTKYEDYYKDSITYSLKTVDSVIYDIIRNDSISYKSYYKFYQSEYLNYLKTSTNSPLFAWDAPYGHSHDNKLYWKPGQFIINDTFSSLSFDWGIYKLDTSNCFFYDMPDVEYSFTIDTKFGLVRHCTGGGTLYWATSCHTLAGAVVSGVKWGITHIPASISETSENKIRVFPNPFRDRIFIDYPGNQNSEYKLTDITGKILMQGKLNGNTIETKSLKPGLYNLLIYNYNTSISTTIIKTE